MQVIDCLSANEHLRSLPWAQLDALAFAFVEARYDDGHELIRSGDRGSKIYLLVEGAISVRSGEREVARLEPGSVFGLLALLDRLPASATCRADGPVRVAELTTSAFALLSSAHAEIAYAFQRALGQQVARDFRRLVTRVRPGASAQFPDRGTESPGRTAVAPRS